MADQDALEQRLAALESEIAELRAQQAATTPAPAKTSLSRRQALVRLGGVAAAAGVAATGAAIATNTSTARAADGNLVVLGAANFETNETSINDDGTVNTFATFLANGLGHASGGANTAVLGSGPFGGNGVHGTGFDESGGNTGIGVVGDTQSGLGIGVLGTANGGSGIGVLGESGTGVGGVFATSSGIDLFLLGTGRFLQLPTIGHPGPPVPADGTFGFFETIKDSNGVMWLSVVDPSSFNIRWVRMGMVNGGAHGGAMNFLPSPVRIIGAGSPPGVSLGKNTHTNFTLANHNGIPADASAVFGNATVLGAGGSGFVTLTPQGGSAATSSLNFTSSDQPLSNFVAVGLNSGGITVFVSNNFNVKFIYDVVGYCL